MIVELRAGKKVGIAATSHTVIENLLEARPRSSPRGFEEG
jgi:hypothetical protein